MKFENLEVPVYWYADENGEPVMDTESMREKFEELLKESSNG